MFEKNNMIMVTMSRGTTRNKTTMQVQNSATPPHYSFPSDVTVSSCSVNGRNFWMSNGAF